jgi:hypothetical protein
MIGTIVWWSDQKTQGLITVTNERGEVQKFFLLSSQIVQRPERITAGYYAKFRDAIRARRPDLLPLAVGVVVSETLTDAGVDALAQAVKS